MKKAILYVAATGLMCAFYACNKVDPSKEDDTPAKPIELTTKQSTKASADDCFAFNIFKEVSAFSGPNTFFSPLSLNMALGMLYNGTSGETRAEMVRALGMTGFTDTEINEYYQRISQALLNVDPRTEIGIANSIWYRNGLSVKQPFIDVNKKYFDAKVEALDFSKPNAADIINKWCADKTKDRIKEIIAKPIPDDIVMYLINALYFKSKWKFEFKKSDTKQADFTKADNQKKKVNMMEQTATLPYYADEHLQCVEMPYGNEAFSMVAILPADNKDIDYLIDYLDYAKWQNIVDRMYQQKVWLKFPRFKIECELPLNEPVKNIGMAQMFDRYRADLTNIANVSGANLFVSFIKQKTFVEVNEAGTEAAAVTVIGIGVTSIGPDPSTPVPFFANRPFLYLIKEKSTGVILFIGRMDEPKE